MLEEPANLNATGARRIRGVAQRRGGGDTGKLPCRRKFLRFFPGGFHDPEYVALERAYKWAAHRRWTELLGRDSFRKLLRSGRPHEIAAEAVRIEGRTNLLFSFEKMALRDALQSSAAARAFAHALFELLHGSGATAARFDHWCETVARLPRRQTRVLTWPVVTVFPFLADPRTHFFFKPRVTLLAAKRYGADLAYSSRPSCDVYAGVLKLASVVRRDLRDLRPRDQIDVQSFLWLQGSDEYDE